MLQIVVMTARLVGGRLSGVKDGVDGGDVVASVAAGMPRGWRMKRLNVARTGSPATILRSTPLTASVAPKRFVRPVAVITASSVVVTIEASFRHRVRRDPPVSAARGRQ